MKCFSLWVICKDGGSDPRTFFSLQVVDCSSKPLLNKVNNLMGCWFGHHQFTFKPACYIPTGYFRLISVTPLQRFLQTLSHANFISALVYPNWSILMICNFINLIGSFVWYHPCNISSFGCQSSESNPTRKHIGSSSFLSFFSLLSSLPPHFFFQVSLPFPYLRRFSCFGRIDLGLCSGIS